MYLKIEKEIRKPLPSWVSKEMYPNIEKKRNIKTHWKLIMFYFNSILQKRMFVSWEDLCTFMDQIAENIKKSGKKYDAIVGIKTGGAILADYLSLKLGIPNYKIKVTSSVYNCKKKEQDLVKYVLDSYKNTKKMDYTVCEGLNENIQGKNIILFDEQINSGKTIKQTHHYLKEIKKVNDIYTSTISLNPDFEHDIPIHYLCKSLMYILAWGYDN